jgi:parallel beta-helix repeat protein
MVFDRNEVAYNNTAGFSPNWAAGGSKFAFTTGLQIRNNFFHHNYGHAIWVDIANYQVLIEGNRVEDNEGRGVFYEISYDAVIRNNTLARNGFGVNPVLGRTACIGVVSSPNVEVYGNQCTGDRDGIVGVQDARGSGPRGAYELTNLYVHDNTLTGIQQLAAGIVQTVNDASYYTGRNNRWSGNVYNSLNSASPFYWSNAARTMTQWRGYGQQ